MSLSNRELSEKLSQLAEKIESAIESEPPNYLPLKEVANELRKLSNEKYEPNNAWAGLKEATETWQKTAPKKKKFTDRSGKEMPF